MIKQYLIKRKWRRLRIKAEIRLLKRFYVHCEKVKINGIWCNPSYYDIDSMSPFELSVLLAYLFKSDYVMYNWQYIDRVYDIMKEKQGVSIPHTLKETPRQTVEAYLSTNAGCY